MSDEKKEKKEKKTPRIVEVTYLFIREHFKTIEMLSEKDHGNATNASFENLLSAFRENNRVFEKCRKKIEARYAKDVSGGTIIPPEKSYAFNNDVDDLLEQKVELSIIPLTFKDSTHTFVAKDISAVKLFMEDPYLDNLPKKE